MQIVLCFYFIMFLMIWGHVNIVSSLLKVLNIFNTGKTTGIMANISINN